MGRRGGKNGYGRNHFARRSDRFGGGGRNGTDRVFQKSRQRRGGSGRARAKIESKIDFIKIQTELISAKSNAISEKLDDQNARLIVVEQKVEAAELCRLPEKLARLEEGLKSAHRRIGELAEARGQKDDCG